ncbi:hypothetical protein HYH03_018869 [Edaphochlamys debaryana]|uniref:ASCH domain-containing protein n=1 Tax=Edaphochlamys debaryana TaxID=47281 RepID=A0A836BP23_9CHLO|nr:hypothetical protein HYH03_018869 [Edaphochlamys debaryana]|eukprot:KAG2482188.1 hypothetical protein HYH03_018869 [Edaphochlamys debaryana]
MADPTASAGPGSCAEGHPAAPATSGEAASASAPPRRAPQRRHSSLMRTYLEAIRSGAKTVEGRIRSGHWADVIPGDEFVFNCSALNAGPHDPPAAAVPPVTVRVTHVRQYDSFEGMLRGEGLGACLPGVASLDAGVGLYRAIPGYAEREASHGVVGLGVEVLTEEGGAGGRAA